MKLLELAKRQARYPRGTIERHPGRLVEPPPLLGQLITLLQHTPDGAEKGSVEICLGARRLADYRRTLGERIDLFTPMLDAAQRLPVTTNMVMAIEPPCTGIHDDPALQEHILGPAGFNLPDYFDSPTHCLALLLDMPHTRASVRECLTIADYRLQLIDERYAATDLLTMGLAGAVCANALDRLLQRAQSLDVDLSHDQKSMRENLKKSFSDLLDLSDTLALQHAESTLRCAQDYHAHGRIWRAQRLVKTWLKWHPDDGPINRMAAALLPVSLSSASQLATLRRAVSSNATDPTLRHQLGCALLERVSIRDALHELTAAVELDPGQSAFADSLQRAKRFGDILESARQPSQMPTVTLDDVELTRQALRPETLALLAHLYRRHGTLAITNAFDPTVLDACRRQFLDEYRQYLKNEKHDDALQIGDRRFQVSLALDGAFNQPAFYANPFVLTLMHRLLGRKAIVGSTVCATSLPGARNQHVHKDHRALFTTDADADPMTLPPVAITTMIPLVPLDERIGTTLVKKGSHRLSRKASEKLPYQAPVLPQGGIFLMDLALSHKGQGNRTDQVRPIVNMVYHQHWFADNKNFRKQPPLQISKAEFARIPKEHRKLFDWAIQPGPRVNLQ